MHGVLDLVSTWTGILTVVVLAHVMRQPVVYGLAVVVIAGLQNHLIVLAHECWHGKAFPNQALNPFVGKWFYSYPVGTPFRADRTRHLDHHRRVGTPDDPDWRDYERDGFHRPGATLAYLAGVLLGGKLWQRMRRDTARRPEASELAGIAACQLVLLGTFTLAASWWEYALLWILPLVTVTSFLISMRALLEHVHESSGARPEDRLYDFAANPLERWFIAPRGFHLHALHHAYPGVPHYRQRTLAKALRERGVDYPNDPHPGYLASLVRHLRRSRGPGS